MRELSIIMIILALPIYGLPWTFAPYVTITLILGAFLLGFIHEEAHRKDG